MNIFSPYEAAKRLAIESRSLVLTGERFLQYLKQLEQVDQDFDNTIIENYESEFQKIESYKSVMMKIIEKHCKGLHEKLLDGML